MATKRYSIIYALVVICMPSLSCSGDVLQCRRLFIDFDYLPDGFPIGMMGEYVAPSSHTAAPSMWDAYSDWGVYFASVGTSDYPRVDGHGRNHFLSQGRCRYPTGFNIVVAFESPVYGVKVNAVGVNARFMTVVAKDQDGRVLATVGGKGQESTEMLSLETDVPISSLECWPHSPQAGVSIDNLCLDILDTETVREVLDSTPKNYGDAMVSRIVSIRDGSSFIADLEGGTVNIFQAVTVRIRHAYVPLEEDCRKVRRDYISELAKKAKGFVEKKLTEANAVKLKNMERGSTFEILADVEVDGQNLAELLYEAGLTKAHLGRSTSIVREGRDGAEMRSFQTQQMIGRLSMFLKMGTLPVITQLKKDSTDEMTLSEMIRLWRASPFGGAGSSLEQLRHVSIRDAWGREFIVRSSGRSGLLSLVSYGADGKPGGTGADSDLTDSYDLASLLNPQLQPSKQERQVANAPDSPGIGSRSGSGYSLQSGSYQFVAQPFEADKGELPKVSEAELEVTDGRYVKFTSGSDKPDVLNGHILSNTFLMVRNRDNSLSLIGRLSYDNHVEGTLRVRLRHSGNVVQTKFSLERVEVK